MNKKAWMPFLIVLLLLLGAGFYFKDSLLKTYDTAQQNLQNIKKTDFGNIVSQVAKNILAPAPLNIGGSDNGGVLTSAKIIAQTNFQRYGNGFLPPLIENAKLDAAAKAKAEDMFRKQYFEHVSPSGVDPGTLVKSFGYDYIISGENLILGNFKNEAEAVQDWMNSPGHRANILNNRFTDIGVAVIKGIYKGESVWIGVQEFGLPLSSCPVLDANLKKEIDDDKIKLDNLSSQIDAKRNEINNTNSRSPGYNALVDQYNQLVDQYNQLATATKNIIALYNSQINEFNQCVAGTK